MEPYRERRWRRASSQEAISFFTCARPGRSKGPDKKVKDETVDLWVSNLPGPNTAIVSLLGSKPDGMSEFSFYSFHSKEPFQAWLDRGHRDLYIHVVEHPTIDLRPIPPEALAAIAADIERLLSERRTVVLVDSGGETRSGQVCRYMGLVEDSGKL